ncbi:uncharacterized protein EAE98_008361 [Botrytis deweyae]|uniref:Uncharacterized protein n=1 Tax=Botrytis deweyae TaxID=2478750 RepID=A0ABQ7IF83_9HELO|nr:uncharacterized protein EAE98_008361 [Botrytis deweyae]KAF7922150.1 hypothetical protein EAE98_008361 [Botrytis deweyae]
MAKRIFPGLVSYSPQAISKPLVGLKLKHTAQHIPAPWERTKPVSQHHLLVAAYFDETWTQKVLADEKIGFLARRYLFNPRFEPTLRERIPNKYAFRMDWLLKQLADEQDSFSMDPFEGEPEYNVHADTGTVRTIVERNRNSAYIPITSQPFVELKRSLLRKVEKEFPPSKIVGKKPEGWLRTWSNLPERPSKLFSFPTGGRPNDVLNDLEDIRVRLEGIGPARVNGFKLMHFKTKRSTEQHDETIIKYYPFKDCLEDYQNRPLSNQKS